MNIKSLRRFQRMTPTGIRKKLPIHILKSDKPFLRVELDEDQEVKMEQNPEKALLARTCEICGKVMKSQNGLVGHLMWVHKRQYRRPVDLIIPPATVANIAAVPANGAISLELVADVIASQNTEIKRLREKLAVLEANRAASARSQIRLSAALLEAQNLLAKRD